jgi:hypothetical protein
LIIAVRAERRASGRVFPPTSSQTTATTSMTLPFAF